MKGWKTLAFSLLLAGVGVVQTFDWVTIVPQDKTWTGVVMMAIGGAIAALRYVTTTPIGQSKSA